MIEVFSASFLNFCVWKKEDPETSPGTLPDRSRGKDTYPVVLGEHEDGRDRSKSCKHAVDACTDNE
jgi:hypothetical protein